MNCQHCHSEIPDDAAFCLRCNLVQPNAIEPEDPRYAAFISYRHLPQDSEIAQQVQKAIETYRLPRTSHRKRLAVPDTATSPHSPTDSSPTPSDSTAVAASSTFASSKTANRPLNPRRLGKCFRDEDELAASPSLPESIQKALAQSRSLIVICSPQTLESTWVQREIETFASLHGRDRIICVLADGDSATSIPPLLKTRMVPDTCDIMREMPAEPLAADLRPESKTKRKAELLRIIAAVAGCNYDDLRQRERRRRLEKLAIAALAATLSTVLVTALALSAFYASRDALAAESRSLAAIAQEQLARGERLQAVETALSALPDSSSDLRRPLVPEAQKALEDALDVNQDTIKLWKPNFAFDAEAKIIAMAADDNGDWVITLDENGTITLMDVFTGATRKTFHAHDFVSGLTPTNSDDWILAAAGPNRCLIGTRLGAGNLACIDTTNGSVLWEHKKAPIDALAVGEDNETFAVCVIDDDGSAAAVVMKIANGEIINYIETSPEGVLRPDIFPACSYDFKTGIVSLSLGKYVISFFTTSDKYQLFELGNGLLHSLHMRDSVLIGASDYKGAGENWWIDIPFMLTAIDTSENTLEKQWTIEGAFSATVAGGAYDVDPYLGNARIHGYAFEGVPSVLFSAGNTLRVISLANGSEVYREDFPNSIVSVGTYYGGDNGDFLAVALADGTLDMRSPSEPNTIASDTLRIIVPYRIDEAILFQPPNGMVVALLHSSNQPERLISYRFDVLTLTDSPECTFDELIEQARELIGDR
ncbi:TIR domain-containing protein [Adlercreutzia caecimuris]|uniref:TIR domain-containing protein n=1 Tax=Adlercreutzia caecimuris TaxID=671266 RepID=UPI002494202F|nr:TIR domain-containing protein [Adlercreutzia caecimuris]